MNLLRKAVPNRTFLRHPALLLALRAALGWIFMHAGMMKIRDPAGFGASLASYRLLPPALIAWIQYQVPWLEVLLGFFLIAGYPRRAPALGITGFSIVFAAAHAQSILRGGSVDCGCFGSGHSMSPGAGLALSGAMFLGAAWLYLTETQFANPGKSGSELGGGGSRRAHLYPQSDIRRF